MALKVFKPGIKSNRFVKLSSTRDFRDDLIAWGGTQVLFLNSVFNNPFITYEAISQPVASATYKIRIASEDDLGNINIPGADPEASGSVVVNAFTLPPRNLEFVVSGSDVAFTWEHSVEGAPDTYNFYGIRDGNTIDRATALAGISGNLKVHTLSGLADGAWKIVLEAVKSGIESENISIVEFTVPDTQQAPPRPGLSATDSPNAEADDTNPFVVTGLELSNVSVGKVKVRFNWFWGVLATKFNIYHNSGSGEVSFAAPAFTFNRMAGSIQEFTTTQLHSSDTNQEWKFAVRAENSNGIEDDNIDIYIIEVDGVAPNLVEDLALDTVI